MPLSRAVAQRVMLVPITGGTLPVKGLIRVVKCPVQPLMVSSSSVSSGCAIFVLLFLLLLFVIFTMTLPFTWGLPWRWAHRTPRPCRRVSVLLGFLRFSLFTFGSARLALGSRCRCWHPLALLLVSGTIVSIAWLLLLLLDRRRRGRRRWCLLGDRVSLPLTPITLSSSRGLSAFEAAREVSQRSHRPNKMLHLFGDQVAQRARVPRCS